MASVQGHSRAGRISIVWLSCAVWLATAACAANRKGVSAVPSIELKIQPIAREVLPGESFSVEVTATNRGSAPVAVADPEAGSPVVFRLFLAGEDRVRGTFSRQAYWVSLSPAKGRVNEPPPVSLAPGGSVRYRDDLGELMTEPPAPGEYELRANYRSPDFSAVSAPVDLVVATPHIEALAQLAVQKGDTLATVFAHRNADETIALFQRETAPATPATGVAYRRHTLAHGAEPLSLALSVGNTMETAGYWFAWLRNGRIGASFGAGEAVSSVVPEQDVKLASPVLVEAGWRHPDRSASFLVAGLEGAQARVREFRFHFVPPSRPGQLGLRSATPNPAVRTFDLGGASVPSRILARYTPTDAEPEIQLVWAATTGGETRILTRLLPGGETRTLYTRREDLLALEMNPEPIEGAPAVADALFGRVTLVRIPLSGAGKPTEWTFREPYHLDPAGARHFPDRWAIAPLAVEEPRALARLENELICLPQGTVTTGAAAAEYIRFAVLPLPDRFGNRVWATWVDPAHGFRLTPVH